MCGSNQLPRLSRKNTLNTQKKLFEKQKKEPQKIIVCADVPPELTLKIAYATGIHKDPWIYFMDQNGRLTQIYASALH